MYEAWEGITLIHASGNGRVNVLGSKGLCVDLIDSQISILSRKRERNALKGFIMYWTRSWSSWLLMKQASFRLKPIVFVDLLTVVDVHWFSFLWFCSLISSHDHSQIIFTSQGFMMVKRFLMMRSTTVFFPDGLTRWYKTLLCITWCHRILQWGERLSDMVMSIWERIQDGTLILIKMMVKME